jgi:mono/diheme cytochrome c family protein
MYPRRSFTTGEAALKKKLMKILGAVLALLLLGGGGFYFWVEWKFNDMMTSVFEVPAAKPVPVPFPLSKEELDEIKEKRLAELKAAAEKAGEEFDPAAVDPLEGVDVQKIALENAIKRGEHLNEARVGCATLCHGANMGGKFLADVSGVIYFTAPNITAGKGGLPPDFEIVDWVRNIRHGVDHNGHPGLTPAGDYTQLSDQEVSDIIAYVQSLPPVDEPAPEIEWRFLGKMLVATENLPVWAFILDHETPRPKFPPKVEPTAEFGEHLAQLCIGCHRSDFSGGQIPGVDPELPHAANLTQDPEQGIAKRYDKEKFFHLMKTGETPEGRKVNDFLMRWEIMSQMSDTELNALWAFISTRPAKKTSTSFPEFEFKGP